VRLAEHIDQSILVPDASWPPSICLMKLGALGEQTAAVSSGWGPRVELIKAYQSTSLDISGSSQAREMSGIWTPDLSC
jgi:hypothetical protein